MIISIYSAVLLTLMFLMNLISFSIMICSIKNYLKNKTKKEVEKQVQELQADITYITNLLANTTDANTITKYTDELSAKKAALAKLQKK